MREIYEVIGYGQYLSARDHNIILVNTALLNPTAFTRIDHNFCRTAVVSASDNYARLNGMIPLSSNTDAMTEVTRLTSYVSYPLVSRNVDNYCTQYYGSRFGSHFNVLDNYCMNLGMLSSPLDRAQYTMGMIEILDNSVLGKDQKESLMNGIMTGLNSCVLWEPAFNGMEE